MLQSVIAPTITNLTCVAIALFGSALVLMTVLRASVFRVAPLAALVVLAFNVATLSGALLGQTIGWRALTFNLRVPTITFAATALFQIPLLAALYVYTSSRAVRALSASLNHSVCKPLGLMKVPREVQLWAMGAVGCVALAWTSFTAYSGEIQYGDVGAKFLIGFTVLAYTPYLIPVIPSLVGGQKKVKVRRQTIFLIVGYTFLLMMLGIARGSRGTFAWGIMNLLMAVGLATLLGQLRLSKRIIRRGLMVVAGLFLLNSALSDLAFAMVIARVDRAKIPTAELIHRTIEAFNDKESLKAYRESWAASIGDADYEENYMSNPFLARFVQIKFFDTMLSLKEVRAGHKARQVWQVTGQKVAAELPTPILRALGYNLDKLTLDFSMGDYLYYVEYGSSTGGYGVGSSVAHGLALFGAAAYVAVIPFFLIVFVWLGAFTKRERNFVIVSPIVLVHLTAIYYLACGDSLLDAVTFIIRTCPQTILIYLLVVQVTKPLTLLRFRTATKTSRLVA